MEGKIGLLILVWFRFQVHRLKIRAWQMLAILTPFLKEGMVGEANELLDQAIKVYQHSSPQIHK